jgi:integrase/recombinase XerD
MSPLEEAARDYLQLRRALGHKMAMAGWLLPGFVAHLESQGLATVTTAAAVAWAEASPHRTPIARNHRLSVARGFARFLTGRDPATEIPPMRLSTYSYQRRIPYLYTRADLDALVNTAGQAGRTPFRGLTMATMIGLLGVTGLRVGEALRLRTSDIDWKAGILTVHASKFGKSRALILLPTVITALRRYDQVRTEAVGTRPATPGFFLTERGKPVQYWQILQAFRRALHDSGVARDWPGIPHLHDLRHYGHGCVMLRIV